jgi:hypothetical protein
MMNSFLIISMLCFSVFLLDANHPYLAGIIWFFAICAWVCNIRINLNVS